MKKITFRAALFAATALMLGMTACKKETIKPAASSASHNQEVFNEEVVVKDKTGTISYTYELISSDKKKIGEMRKELETMTLVPITTEEANQMAERVVQNNQEDNVIVNLDISYTEEFFSKYQQYKGQKIGFAVKPTASEKTYQSNPAWYGINNITSSPGLCSFVLFNQSYYFFIGSLSNIRSCVFTEERSGSYYNSWSRYDFTPPVSDESLSGTTPVNNITRVNASTALWVSGNGKMDFFSSIWVP